MGAINFMPIRPTGVKRRHHKLAPCVRLFLGFIGSNDYLREQRLTGLAIALALNMP